MTPLHILTATPKYRTRGQRRSGREVLPLTHRTIALMMYDRSIACIYGLIGYICSCDGPTSTCYQWRIIFLDPSKLLKVTANILDGVLTLNWIKNINESNVRVSVQAIEESTGKVKPRVDNERDGVIVDWLNPSTCYTFKVSAMHGDKMGPPTVLRNIRMREYGIWLVAYYRFGLAFTHGG